MLDFDDGLLMALSTRIWHVVLIYEKNIFSVSTCYLLGGLSKKCFYQLTLLNNYNI